MFLKQMVFDLKLFISTDKSKSFLQLLKRNIFLVLIKIAANAT